MADNRKTREQVLAEVRELRQRLAALEQSQPQQLEKDRVLNEELQIANEEMQVQAEELRVANEDLEVQAEELQTQNEELQVQRDELARLAADLEAQKLLLEAVLRQMPGAVVIAEAPSGRVILANVQKNSLQGFHAGGQPYRPAEWPLARSLHLGEVVSEEEIRLAQADGSHRIVSVNSTPVRDHEGRIIAGVEISFDITDRRRAEAETERFVSFPRLNPNPVLEIDADGAVTFHNQAAISTLEKLGLPADPKAFLPGDLGEIQAAARQPGAGGFYREVQLKEAVFAVYLHYVAVFDAFRLFAMDITERQRGEEVVRRAKEEWERTFDAVPDLIAILDDQHRIVRANRAMAQALGKTPAELAGLKCYEHMHGTSCPPSFCPHAKLLADGLEHNAEVHELGLDFLVTASPLTDDRGKVCGSVHVARDITERKRAEEELRLSNQRLDLLAETAGQLLVSDSPQEIVDSLCWRVMEFLDCDAFFNFLVVDEKAGLLHLNACAGIPEEEARRIQWLEYGAAVCGCAARDGCRIVSENIQTTDDPRTELVKSYGIQAYACHPLMVRGRVLGTLSFGTRKKTSFPPDELALMKAVADQVAIAMARKLAEEALQRANDELEQRVAERTEDLEETVAQLEEEISDRQRAETALDTERKRLFAVLERMPAHVSLIRPDHTYAYVNGEFVRRFGEPGERHCYERLGLPGPCGECQAMAVFHTGTTVTWEWTGPEGKIYRIFDYPFTDVDGSPLVLEMGIDITEARQAEAEIRQQAALLDLAHDAIIVRDLDSRILYWNRGAEETYGFKKAAALNQTTHSLLQTQSPISLGDIDQALRQQGHWYGELGHIKADGTTMVVASRQVLQKNEAGEPTAVLEINRDITARRQAERQAESLGRLYRFLSRVNETIVRARDREALYREVCRVAVEEGRFRMAWVGLVDPEAQAIKVAAQFGFEEGYLEHLKIPLADVPEGRGPTGTAVREGRLDVCNDYAAEPRMAPWREAALARGYRSSAAFPLRVASKVVGVLTLYAERAGFFNDEEIGLLQALTGDLSFALESMDREDRRRRAEEEMRAVSAYARSLIEASLDPLVTISSAGKITDVNRATEEATGIARGCLIGTDFSDYFTEPDKAREGYQQVFSQGFVRDYPLTLRHASGGNLDVLYNATIYKNEAGEVQGVLAAARDITERRRAEQEIQKLNAELEIRVRERTAQLEAANKELEAFSYSVSHDLKAPIRAIEGFSRMLAAEHAASLEAEGLRFLEVICQNTRIMAQLIDDLLALSRLGRQTIRKSVINLGAMTRRVFDQIRDQEPDRELQLTLGELPPALGDPSLINQVVMNLLANAIKYTRSRETAAIEVSGRIEAQETIYCVKDNGIGFDERYAHKLFGVFQRLHGSQEYEGTGVGLAIVQRIVERHGGRVWAAGKVNEGATFCFSLPRGPQGGSEPK